MKTKRSFLRLLIISVASLFVLVGIFFSSNLSESASSNVTVTATVGSSVTCSSSGSPNFTSLTTGAVSAASAVSTTTFSCNSGTGCNITISSTALNGVAGLASSSANALIESMSSTYTTATLIAGLDGYGIQVATSSAGAGSILSVLSRWVRSSDDVGFVSSTQVEVASASTPFSSREISATHKAAVGALTAAGGGYSATLTYTCISN